MRTSMHRLWSVFLAAAFGIAAGAPVAMRVELEPLGPAGAETEVMVIVQISPEDRGRIGDNVILRVEMDGGAVGSGSPMRALRLEDDGSARFSVAWPPGEHDLRVQIEDRGRQNTGLWVGKVRIPDLSSRAGSVPEPGEQAAAAAERPGPAPASEPTPESPPVAETGEQAAAAAEQPETAPEPAPEPASTSETPPVAEAGAIAATTPITRGPEPEREPEPERTEPSSTPVAPPPVAAEPPIEELAEPSVVDEPEQTVAEEDVAGPPADEPEKLEDELPIVEPLRSEAPPGAAEPPPSGTGAPSASAGPAAALPAEIAARIGAWEDADPDTREIPIVVMDGREPVLDVERDALSLRVGGSEVPVEELGGAESSPLLLGLAVDVSTEEIDGWSGARGSLAPLAERAGGGRGELFVANSAGVGDWDTEPGSRGAASDAGSGGNVARLVVDSLKPFDGRRGRTFLVVLTDGRNEPSKAEWAEATEAASAAGVPILVVALWDEAFSHRTRKNLKQLTVVSGGSLFLVQGSAQLDSAADRFGRQLDGSYALRFRPSAAAQGKLTAISVTASDRKLDVSAPKSIR